MIQQIKKIFFAIVFSTGILSAQINTTIELQLTEKTLPFGIIEKVPVSFPKIGLALSGGGARSISQLGVLRAFEEENIPINMILGTSMGSIVGGLYSAGYSLTQLDSILKIVDWNSFFSPQQSGRNELFIDQKITEDRAIVTFRLDGFNLILPTAVSTGQRASNFLNLLAVNAPIQNYSDYDKLLYKYRAISSDLVSGKEVVLNKGPLGTSMRASSSVTLLLPPVKSDTLLLVDGGLVANVPARQTKKMGADIIVAVNSSSPLYTQPELNFPWIIADQLVSIPMNILNDQQLEVADFVITPSLNGRKNNDFRDFDFLVEQGYKAGKAAAVEIKKDFIQKFKSSLELEERYFRNLTISNDADEITKEIFDKINFRDSVSIEDLYYKLYEFQRTGRWSEIKFHIEEQKTNNIFSVVAIENPLIEDIIIAGAYGLDLVWLEEFIASNINKYFSGNSIFSICLNLIREYRNNGYSLANIKSVSFNNENGTLIISVEEGVVESINVSGNRKTNPVLILRELPMNPGEIFKYESAEKGLVNIRSTDLFENVELTADLKDGKVNVNINITEKVTGILRAGFRIDNENFNQLSLDIREENLFGSGTEIGFTASGGSRNRSFSLEQKSNRVFETYLTYKLKFFHDFNDVNVYKNIQTNTLSKFRRDKSEEYRQIFYGGSFGIGSQVQKFGNLLFEARYQRDEIKNKSDYSGQTYKIDISSFRISLSVDSQNDYPFPTSGIQFKGYYETAQTALGGDIGYAKIFIDYKSILSLSPNHVWGFRTMVGFADNTLPLSQQFSLGGQNSFFGMRDYEYRGRQVILGSLEYRYKLPFKLFFDSFVKLRYDLGSIWENREAIRFKDLQHGTGATLSIKTPIGPADFSVGKSFLLQKNISNNPILWGPTYFYFTIGYYY